MRTAAGIIIIICLLFCGTAGAVGIPDSIVVTTDRLWTIADNASQSTVIIKVTNTTPGYSGNIPGVVVHLAVDPVYGSMSPVTVTTDLSGTATSTFQTKTKSGAAQITASVTAPALSSSTYQNIDHDVLYPKFTPGAGTVGEEIAFTVLITDQWGNPIDARRSDDTVTLSVSCPLPNDCGFTGYGHSYSSRPDSNGNLAVPLRLGTKTGVAAVVMSPVQDLGQQEMFIETVPAGLNLTADISPGIVPPYTIPTVPVNTGEFTFIYTLSDKFGNPVANQPVLITTSLNEEQLTRTNSLGQTPIQTYGPKNTVSTVVITAAVVNSTPAITNQFSVAFTHTEAQDMTFIVSPQSMKSLESDPASHADVVVRILDNFGNPVSGEDVTFSLGSSSYSPLSVPINNPSLTSSGGKTDADGKVTTVFKPGSFSGTGISEGSCELTAVWNKNPSPVSRAATMSWTNRAYLNINTSVSPQIIKVNDTIDVTIEVTVNGDRHNYRPITAMLDLDTSGSMVNPSDIKGVSRLDAATGASSVFIDGLDESNDQIGLESFGYKKQNLGHLPIPTTFADMKSKMSLLKTGADSGGMGLSITDSFNKIISATSLAGHEDDVKVLVLLSDGGSNLDSDLTTIVNTAKANNISVFTISYLNGASDSSQALDQMGQFANQTGGVHYTAASSADLATAFARILEEIKILADTDTTMQVSFDNVVINSTAYDGLDVYDYIPDGPFNYPDRTTHINQVNTSSRTSVIWPDGNQTVQDQSGQWAAHNLQFFVGAIDLNEKWTATFRLKVKKAGTFNVFSPGSQIVLNGKPIPLPDTPVTVLPENPQEGMLTGTLSVENLHELNAPATGYYNDFVSLQWNTKYNSKTNSNLVTEYVYYRINGGPWKQFDTRTAPWGDSTQSTTLDVRKLPAGSYDIRVHAYPNAKDATDADSNVITVTVKHQSDTPYLNLS